MRTRTAALLVALAVTVGGAASCTDDSSKADTTTTIISDRGDDPAAANPEICDAITAMGVATRDAQAKIPADADEATIEAARSAFYNGEEGTSLLQAINDAAPDEIAADVAIVVESTPTNAVDETSKAAALRVGQWIDANCAPTLDGPATENPTPASGPIPSTGTSGPTPEPSTGTP